MGAKKIRSVFKHAFLSPCKYTNRYKHYLSLHVLLHKHWIPTPPLISSVYTVSGCKTGCYCSKCRTSREYKNLRTEEQTALSSFNIWPEDRNNLDDYSLSSFHAWRSSTRRSALIIEQCCWSWSRIKNWISLTQIRNNICGLGFELSTLPNKTTVTISGTDLFWILT